MFPHERSLVKKLEGRPFVLLGVNGDPKEGLKEKNEKQGITWRSFQNERGGEKGSISTEFNLRGWPTLYLIDHKGVIRHKWLGGPPASVLDPAIEKLVKEAEEELGKKGTP